MTMSPFALSIIIIIIILLLQKCFFKKQKSACLAYRLRMQAGPVEPINPEKHV